MNNNYIFQEEENLTISEDCFMYIKQVSEEYTKYITSYKVATNEYIKKLSFNQEKYKPKLSEPTTELKNVSSHINKLISRLPKIIDQQISYLKDFISQLEERTNKFENFVKEKTNEFGNYQGPFKDIKAELVKKYQYIEKIKVNYLTNIITVENNIHKYYIKKNNRKKSMSTKNNGNSGGNNYNTEPGSEPGSISLEEQVNSSINKTRKIEEEYITEISKVKNEEKKYIDIGEKSKTNERKILCQISSQLKELASDFMVLINNYLKFQLSEIDTYLQEIVSSDEYSIFNDIIISSYKNDDNNLKPVNPEKYTLKFFKKKHGSSTMDNLNKKKVKFFDEDLQELDFDKEEEVFMTIKKMKENFDLIEDNDYDIEKEEEKLHCKYLTLKILSFAPQSKVYSNKIPNITPSEVDDLDKMLRKKENRSSFIQKLSQFRTRGIFEIPEREYNILSRLFNNIVNDVESNQDYEAAVNMIILSQTYYITKNNNKEYLQNAIMKNDLFKSKKFWETFIIYLIEKETEKSKKEELINGQVTENEKENEEKLSNIAFAQIVPITNNMFEFGLDANTIEEIVLPFIETYKISPELSEIMKATINSKRLELEAAGNNNPNNNNENKNEIKEMNSVQEKKPVNKINEEAVPPKEHTSPSNIKPKKSIIDINYKERRPKKSFYYKSGSKTDKNADKSNNNTGSTSNIKNNNNNNNFKNNNRLKGHK